MIGQSIYAFSQEGSWAHCEIEFLAKSRRHNHSLACWTLSLVLHQGSDKVITAALCSVHDSPSRAVQPYCRVDNSPRDDEKWAGWWIVLSNNNTTGYFHVPIRWGSLGILLARWLMPLHCRNWLLRFVPDRDVDSISDTNPAKEIYHCGLLTEPYTTGARTTSRSGGLPSSTAQSKGELCMSLYQLISVDRKWHLLLYRKELCALPQ